MKKIKIGILGFGNVGQGVLKILNENKEYIREKCDAEIIPVKILVQNLNKKRDIEIEDNVLTDKIDDIFESEIDIILELMGGLEVPREYILKALNKKIPVISANKMCIANYGKEIVETAIKNETEFRYEASVAGGIPIINGINTSLTANKIESIIGIINGTTNYILTKMDSEAVSLEDALNEAKKLGYAEADPTSDIENFDLMYKLQILSKLAFGIDTKDIYREGITKIEKIDIDYAKELGYVIKSVAVGKVSKDNEIELRVHPAMLSRKHPLANVNDSFNAILIRGNAVGDVMFYGRGAGDLPTGSAVVSDLISVIINKNKGVTENSVIVNRGLKVQKFEDNISEYYIRAKVKDTPGILAEITGGLGKNNISVRSIIQKDKLENDTVNLVIITHTTTEGQIQKFVEGIKNKGDLVKVKNIVRIQN